LAVLQAAAPSAAGASSRFLEKAVGAGVEALGDFAARLLELFAGRREPRDRVAAGFAKLVRRALEAEPYIDDDRLEAVVDQVALEWGMDVKTFKALVKNLAALGKDRAAGLDLERLEEVVRREVEGVFKKVEDALREVKTQVSGLLAGVKVAFVGDVEAGLLYHNFVVVGGAPRVKTRAAGGQGDVVVDVVTGGVFGRLAGEVLERLERDGLVVLVGPHGVGKSTLAAYAAWLALWRGAADAVVSAEEVKTGLASALENLQNNTGRRFLLLYDPVPVTAYYEPRAVGEEAEKEKERVRRAVEEALCAAGRGVKALVVLPDELYRDLPPETKQAVEKYVVKAVLNDVEFLHSVIKTYSSCEGEYNKLAEKIARFKGGYTLAAKYAGLWLRERGCDVSDVEKAVEEAKKEPKLFFAHYIWHVLLRGSGDLARKAAVPLLLHAVFGPVPVGVTYITKAVKNGVWRFLKPEELEGASLESLREDELEPIAKWLAQQHEDLVEETLRDLAGLNGEEAREPYREALGDLIKALDWARDEVLKEGGKILAEVGIPKEEWILRTALWAFVNQRLAAVFKSGESRRCWQRAAFIAGHALAGYPMLPRRSSCQRMSQRSWVTP
jgi:KaiC/GvpD/RAD55 family RecA-like ATPase